MKQALIGVGFSAVVLAATSALSADMPVKARPAPVMVAATTWTGCYIGANVGGGWSDSKWINFNNGGGISFDYSPDGIVGGGQVGCDWQHGQFVFGIQGMFDGSGIKGSGNILPGQGVGVIAETKVSWFATLTGRIGYAVAPNWLLYVKGGGAWVRSKHTEFTTAGALFAGPDTLTHNGWTVGGGIEWMFAPQWSVFAEYGYMDLKKKRAPLNFFDIEQDVQVVLVGVNYRFGGGPVVARY
jgi:outer membrane immunogenic protein